MLSTFQAALVPMLTMFCCILVGLVLKKKNILPEDSGTVLSRLETYVLCPALTLGTFSRNCTMETFGEKYILLGYSALIVVLSIAIAIPLSKLFVKKGYQQGVYRYALAFANTGFMGNAVVQALFGDEVLFLYMLFCLPVSIGIYTWGISQMIPGDSSFRSVLKRVMNPSTVAMLIGTVLGLTGLGAQLPDFLSQALTNLGNCMGPIAMVLTGFIVGGYSMKEMFCQGRVYVASLLRLIVLPSLLCGLLYFLGADTLTLTLSLIALGMPLGLNTVVFPAAYGGETKTGASMAIISHGLSVVTIPLMYALLLLLPVR